LFDFIILYQFYTIIFFKIFSYIIMAKTRYARKVSKRKGATKRRANTKRRVIKKNARSMTKRRGGSMFGRKTKEAANMVGDAARQAAVSVSDAARQAAASASDATRQAAVSASDAARKAAARVGVPSKYQKSSDNNTLYKGM
jgi:type IV secretory pathway TrbL component